MAKSRQTGDLVSDLNIFVDIANDRVGIGTTNPTSKLNVVDNSSSDAVRITQLGAGNAFVVEDSTNPDITPFVINAGGSVGIGTTNPSRAVHLFKSGTGTSNLDQAVFRAENLSSVSSYASFNTVSDTATINLQANSSTRTSPTRLGQVVGGWGELYSTSGNGLLIGNSHSAPIIIGTNDTEALRIDSSQRVGIGTTNPLGTLQVGAAGTTTVVVTSTGFVGIGTTNPSEKLEVYGAIRAQGGNVSPSSGNEYHLSLISSDPDNIPSLITTNSSYASIQIVGGGIGSGSRRGGQIDINAGAATTDPGTLIFRTGTGFGGTSQPERVRIDASGNVGIGTTNPQAKLEIRSLQDTPTLTWNGSGQTIIGDTGVQLAIGRVTSNPFGIYLQGRASNNAARDILLNPVGGNVGIGTTNPSYALHVYASDANGIFIDDSNTTFDAPHIRVRGKRSDNNDSQAFSGQLILEKYQTNQSTISNINLGAIIFGGNYDASPGVTTGMTYGASIGAISDGTFSDINTAPTSIVFNTGTVGLGTLGLPNITYGTEAARITSNRNLLIGTTTETGSKLQVQGDTNINNTLPSTVSYASSFSVAGQETAPQEISFSNDGKTMYVLGSTGDDITWYTLSTPWDITTATYVSEFSVAGQEAGPIGLYFKPDGTKFYVVGTTTNDAVYQYSCRTPWDLTTASYDSVSYNVVEDTSPQGVEFKPDGTRMYVVGATNDRIYQYSLSTPWDVSTVSYGSSFSVVNQESGPQGIRFSLDGTKLLLTGSNGDDINYYTLSTPWDISTLSFVGIITTVGVAPFGETLPSGLYWKPDGTRLYLTGSIVDAVWQFNMTSDADLEVTGKSSVYGNLDVYENTTAYGEISAYENAYFYSNVGIGTTNPQRLLHLYTDDNAQLVLESPSTLNDINLCDIDGSVRIRNAGGELRFFTGGDPSSVNVVNGTTKVAITTTGDVLLGSTSSTGTASQPLQVNGGAYISGSVGIGTTNPLVSLHVAGNIRTSTLAGAGNRAVYSDPTGTLTNSSSDETLKENVLPITYGLDTVCQLNPIFFNWIDTERFGPQREIGLIAQQVQSLIPEVVGVNYDETLSLDYSKLTSVLIKSIQELKVENDLLRSEIEAIKQHVGITSINT